MKLYLKTFGYVMIPKSNFNQRKALDNYVERNVVGNVTGVGENHKNFLQKQNFRKLRIMLEFIF